MKERLQKIMSRAGVASRRKAEELILQGQVRVNNQVVKELGAKADARRDRITVAGQVLEAENFVYYLFYKPKGVVTTLKDPQGRTTVADYFKNIKERVYPVGRLDQNTEGLLLVTNDGDLTHRLEHPSHEIEKEYEVKIKGQIGPETLQKLRDGVPLDDGVTSPAKVWAAPTDGRTGITLLSIVLHEGRNRQIRRMLEHFGYRVHNLKRVRYAQLTLQGMKRGSMRKLTAEEVSALYEQAGL